MANPNIYLHEIITIVGAGSEPYKAHTAFDADARWRDGRALLAGTWQQSGSTGEWPRVVNLWEMRGWDHWAELLDAQYRGVGQPPALRRWWNKALEWRSGGLDRILEPAPYSPACADLAAGGVRGRACLQEIATVRAGAADDYLDAVRRRWVPVAARRGLTLLGAFRTAMRETETVLLWSLPSFRHVTDHLKTVRSAPEARRWVEAARRWRTDWRETLLVPSRWCITHPDWTPPPARAAGRTRGSARRVRP